MPPLTNNGNEKLRIEEGELANSVFASFLPTCRYYKHSGVPPTVPTYIHVLRVAVVVLYLAVWVIAIHYQHPFRKAEMVIYWPLV